MGGQADVGAVLAVAEAAGRQPTVLAAFAGQAGREAAKRTAGQRCTEAAETLGGRQLHASALHRASGFPASILEPNLQRAQRSSPRTAGCSAARRASPRCHPARQPCRCSRRRRPRRRCPCPRTTCGVGGAGSWGGEGRALRAGRSCPWALEGTQEVGCGHSGPCMWPPHAAAEEAGTAARAVGVSNNNPASVGVPRHRARGPGGAPQEGEGDLGWRAARAGGVVGVPEPRGAVKLQLRPGACWGCVVCFGVCVWWVCMGGGGARPGPFPGAGSGWAKAAAGWLPSPTAHSIAARSRRGCVQPTLPCAHALLHGSRGTLCRRPPGHPSRNAPAWLCSRPAPLLLHKTGRLRPLCSVLEAVGSHNNFLESFLRHSEWVVWEGTRCREVPCPGSHGWGRWLGQRASLQRIPRPREHTVQPFLGTRPPRASLLAGPCAHPACAQTGKAIGWRGAAVVPPGAGQLGWLACPSVRSAPRWRTARWAPPGCRGPWAGAGRRGPVPRRPARRPARTAGWWARGTAPQGQHGTAPKPAALPGCRGPRRRGGSCGGGGGGRQGGGGAEFGLGLRERRFQGARRHARRGAAGRRCLTVGCAPGGRRHRAPPTCLRHRAPPDGVSLHPAIDTPHSPPHPHLSRYQ